jgi:hypothetical protein
MAVPPIVLEHRPCHPTARFLKDRSIRRRLRLRNRQQRRERIRGVIRGGPRQVRAGVGIARAAHEDVALSSRFCSILGTRVTVITDLEGTVATVCCPQYHRETRACRLKSRATSGGRLSELLERSATGRITDQTARCQFD